MAVKLISTLHKTVVIFDLDGTLINFRKAQYLATKEVFKSNSTEFSFQLGKYNEKYGFEKGSELLGISLEEMKLWDQTFLNYLDTDSQLHSSVLGILESLALKGVSCSINTNRNKSPSEIHSLLNKYSIGHHFTNIQTFQSTGVSKPDPKGIHMIVSGLKAQYGDCYFVGDSIVDIMTGKNAGVKTIAVTTGFFSKADFLEYEPNFIIEDLQKLTEKLT